MNRYRLHEPILKPTPKPFPSIGDRVKLNRNALLLLDFNGQGNWQDKTGTVVEIRDADVMTWVYVRWDHNSAIKQWPDYDLERL